MSNVHNFQTSIICQVLHATLRVSEGSTIPTIELIAICDAFWKIVTFLALAIHIVSHSFMLGGIHPWQRHEECIIRAPSLEKIFLWCYHCSADEWLELCTATKLISPDPMLLIWRSDLNLNIFMCNLILYFKHLFTLTPATRTTGAPSSPWCCGPAGSGSSTRTRWRRRPWPRWTKCSLHLRLGFPGQPW